MTEYDIVYATLHGRRLLWHTAIGFGLSADDACRRFCRARPYSTNTYCASGIEAGPWAAQRKTIQRKRRERHRN